MFSIEARLSLTPTNRFNGFHFHFIIFCCCCYSRIVNLKQFRRSFSFCVIWYMYGIGESVSWFESQIFGLRISFRLGFRVFVIFFYFFWFACMLHQPVCYLHHKCACWHFSQLPFNVMKSERRVWAKAKNKKRRSHKNSLMWSVKHTIQYIFNTISTINGFDWLQEHATFPLG